MDHYQILVIGAGTGGIMTAAQLRNKNSKLKIAIIDPAESHFYQPAYTLVGAGTYDFEDTRRDMKSVIPKGVKWIKDEVTHLYPKSNSLNTKQNGSLSYDFLIVSPGIQINIDDLEGLREAMETDFVCSNYVDPKKTWKVIQSFKEGNALFTQPDTPIKCGGAPQKIMYLADDYFRKQGKRKNAEVVYATPGSVIFGVEDFKKTLLEIIERKHITFKPKYIPFKIDAKEKIAYFKNSDPEYDPSTYKPDENIGEVITPEGDIGIPYGMLHLAPPQSAPDFIRNSELADEGGWLDVDKHTLQHNHFKNIFGLGDVTSAPTAKTGAAVRKQAPVVVENILTMIEKEQLSDASYSGYSSCPIVTGYGKMVLAEFKYDNVRDSDPIISKFLNPAKESWLLWILKKYGLPYLYWHRMLKGKM